MDFDERLIKRENVEKAIEKYLRERPKHTKARSAFLLWGGEKQPAKFILRLAFEDATGTFVVPETLTGGKASVRVLESFGFDAVYEKPERISAKNLVKSARREALKKVLEKRFGLVEKEWKHKDIIVPDLTDRSSMSPILLRILDAIEAHRNKKIKGKKGLNLRFDFHIPKVNLVIEFDERQHFTPLRAVSLLHYPNNVKLGFDKDKWITRSEEIRAGDNDPVYRDEQRAFYDSIRDIMAPQVGLLPVYRIFEEDVKWEKEGDKSKEALVILKQIQFLIEHR
jgi:hypothetical protein